MLSCSVCGRRNLSWDSGYEVHAVAITMWMWCTRRILLDRPSTSRRHQILARLGLQPHVLFHYINGRYIRMRTRIHSSTVPEAPGSKLMTAGLTMNISSESTYYGREWVVVLLFGGLTLVEILQHSTTRTFNLEYSPQESTILSQESTILSQEHCLLGG